MNWFMPSCIEIRIGRATMVAALIAVSGLIVPTQALAKPAPLNVPDYAIDATKLSSETNDTNIPASPNGLRYTQLPLPVSHGGGSHDDYDDNDDEFMYS